MRIAAVPATLADIASWREVYQREMHCQIIHDSIHERDGWTVEYLLLVDDRPLGYGSIAVGGPWTDKPTVYEFYVAPEADLQVFDMFRALLAASGAVNIEAQSNDSRLTIMLHTFSARVISESILFRDSVPTAVSPAGAIFRIPSPAEEPGVPPDLLRWRGVIELDGQVVANGGILFHYNRPFGDIYMDVQAAFRRRGLGSFLVQELKRVCYQGGHLPAARCATTNIASRRTLQKAGFVPCGHLLTGRIAPPGWTERGGHHEISE